MKYIGFVFQIDKELFVKFEINDMVFYPGHGVAVIESEVEKSISGNTARFFKLKFIYKDVTILIPINSKSETVYIRSLSSKDLVEQAYNELYKEFEKKSGTVDFSPSCWNRRNKDYQLKIQKGDLLDIARVYRDLMHISHEKELSFGERKILQTTKELLLEEILLVANEPREVVMQKLQIPFQQMHFGEAATKSSTISAIL